MNNKIKQVVIWGHKLHSHTHSYIHYGFYNTFNYLGYKTYWYDCNDNIELINFDNTLFIVEGQVDENIPINNNSYYVLHNCMDPKYKQISTKNKIILQVYTYDADKRWGATKVPNSKCSFYNGDCLWQPWATDLLPYEIDNNIKNIENSNEKIALNSPQNKVNFIGMMIPPWDNFRDACIQKGLEFEYYGGFLDDKKVSSEENMNLIKESLIAPALQSQWQVDNGYIPCRIFKNISYGKMGITNNEVVYKLFEEKILYSTSIEELLEIGIEFENKVDKNEIIIELMKDVRDNHTFINRINTILWFLEKRLNE